MAKPTQPLVTASAVAPRAEAGCDVFVGRQPIFDRDLGVFAYELLYRAGPQAGLPRDMSGDQATTEVLLNAFTEFGLERLLGRARGCVNLTERYLLGKEPLPFGPERIIIEVLEDIPVTPALVEAVGQHKRDGFTIALDDYQYRPDHEPLLQLADIVKLDLMALSPDELARHTKELSRFGVKLVAERVETMEDFQRCLELGFDFFQGFFLSRPQVLSVQKLPTNRLAVLNLLAVLSDADADNEDLVDAINADMSVSYRVLKLINSALFSLTRTVDSVHQAVSLLGRRKLATWASMLALSSMDDRPSELLRIAMTRAKMCELLAEHCGLRPQESFFTVGLFSALDMLMERPLCKLIEPLPLREDIVAALLHREGTLGEALRCVLAYEMADWDEVGFAGLGVDAIAVANIEAVTWANGVIDSLQ